MAVQYFDRYKEFKINGQVKPVPGIFLDPKPTDKRVVYNSKDTRLDILSNQYYNNPYHGFLILAANPQFGGLEFMIPENEIIRVPFPFKESVDQYVQKIRRYKDLYGD